jgi:N-acetylmuramoyl-L-alanine amidase
MPAVLIECGYVDNAADIARVKNDEELDKLCRTILSGLVAYQNNVGK